LAQAILAQAPSPSSPHPLVSCRSKLLSCFPRVHLEMALRFCFNDTDGDALEFRLTAQGRLQELQGGRIEIAEVRVLEYVAAEGLMKDAGGDFNFRPEERDDKVMALRALAACAGVAWHGDEPRVPECVRVTDADGDALEFRIAADGRLQEYVNGELEVGDVRRLTYSRRDGRVFDGEGDFRLRAPECLEKSVLLRALAARAGVEWSGDEPVPLRKEAVASWLRHFARREAEPSGSRDAGGEAPAAEQHGDDSDEESWELLSCGSSRSCRSGGWELLEVERRSEVGVAAC